MTLPKGNGGLIVLVKNIMYFLLMILVYKVVSVDFDQLSPSHLEPKFKDLGLQAATRPVAVCHWHLALQEADCYL